MSRRRCPFPLFHWSPVERRKAILRRGLVPRSISRDGEWRAPHVCFAETPSLAWGLSGGLSETAADWDLWMTWSNVARFKPRADLPQEHRTRQRVPKRELWHVGTITHTP